MLFLALVAVSLGATDAGFENFEALPPSPATDVGPAPQDGGTDTNPTPYGPLSERSLIREDLDPSVRLLETEDLELRFGSFLQVHTALYTGSEALISNGDVASEPGFRLRRARIGIEGRLGKKAGIFLNINLLEADTEVGTVADAKLTYTVAPCFGLAVGTSKVAFSRGALLSSRSLVGIERPRSVGEISPSRRLGLTAEGSVLSGKLGYVASLMNGTEGFAPGNQFGGFLGAARIEVAPYGNPDTTKAGATGVGAGFSVLHDQGPSVKRDAVSVDLVGAFNGASLLLEMLCDRANPLQAPFGNPPLAQTERCGMYAEAAYAFVMRGFPLQLTARVESFDDNRRLSDAGDQLLVSGGVNVQPIPYVRVQLQYFMRKERAGIEQANDVLVASFQGAF